jgi:hypothetical protein
VRTLVMSKLISSAGRYAIPGRLALLAGIVTATAALAQTVPPSPANQQPQTSPPSASPARAQAAKATKVTKPAGPPSRYLPNRFAGRAGLYYRMVWGIDSPTLKWTESGEVIRFSWRVLDPQKASALNDKKIEPSLIDPRAGVSLVVPQMEKIGQLRQSAPPEAGKSYWMAFSNKGLLVKRGDRVVVVVGPFHADGLVVD